MSIPFANMRKNTKTAIGDRNDRSPSIYDMGGSLVFDGSKKNSLELIQVDGDRSRYTFSFWVRRSGYAGTGTNKLEIILGHNVINSSSAAGLFGFDGEDLFSCNFAVGATNYRLTARQPFNDHSTFYHFLINTDTTIADGTNRRKLYVNGRRVTDLINNDIVPQNALGAINSSAIPLRIGALEGLTHSLFNGAPFNGELADIALCAGQTLGPEHFGYFAEDGTWRPKKVDTSGWTGPNSFFLNFKEDVEAKGNTVVEWDSNNLGNSPIDRLTPTPGVTGDLAIIKYINYPTVSCSLFDSLRPGWYSHLSNYSNRHKFGGDVINSLNGDEFLKTQLWYNNNVNVDGTPARARAHVWEAKPEFGLDIVNYVGNGTNRALDLNIDGEPDLALIIRLTAEDTPYHYHVYAKGATNTNTKTMFLSTNGPVWESSNNTYWENSLTTVGKLGLGTHQATNGNGESYMAYVFTSVPGYSHYTHLTITPNWQVVTCGFRPNIVLWKATATNASWVLVDMKTLTGIILENNQGTAISVTDALGSVTDTGYSVKTGGNIPHLLFAFADTSQLRDFMKSTFGNAQFTPKNFDGWSMLGESTPEKPSLILDGNTVQDLLNHSTGSNAKIVDGGYGLQRSTNANSDYSMATFNRKLPDYGKWYLEVDYCRAISIIPSSIYTDRKGGGTPDNFNVFDSDTRIQAITGDNKWHYGEHGRRRITLLIDRDNGTVEARCSDGFIIKDILKPEQDTIAIETCRTTWVTDAYVNVGQNPFAMEMPIGYRPLKDIAGLPQAIMEPKRFFKATTYNGNGTSQEINVGFQPDLVWIKPRDIVTVHGLYDSVRGPGNWLSSDRADAQAYGDQNLTGFTSDGFTVGTNIGTNGNGQRYLAWAWKASPESGFDVVKYTGNGADLHKIPHNCGGVPELLFIKNLNTGSYWNIGSKELLDNQIMFLNTDDAIGTYGHGLTHVYNSLTTAQTFTVGVNVDSNGNGNEFIAYLWRSIEGFSKIGIYKGNDIADGPFINCGFRPAFVMIKNMDVAGGWAVADSSMSPDNPVDRVINMDTDGAERTANNLFSFHSNGFKLTSPSGNGSNTRLLYMAFAENPFYNTNAR